MLSITAVVGDLFQSVPEPPYEDSIPGDGIAHPNYNENTFENDIAVVILRRAAQLSSDVQAIALPSATFKIGLFKDVAATSYGWGRFTPTSSEHI